MRPTRWLRNTAAAITVATAACSGGGGGGIVDPLPETNTRPTIELTQSPDTLELEENGTWTVRATDNNTEPANQLEQLIANWGSTADTIPINGTTANHTFTHAYNDPGNKTPTFTAKDKKGLTASTTANTHINTPPPPPTYNYTFTLTEITNHHTPISGGTITIDDTLHYDIPAIAHTITINTTAGEKTIRYKGDNHTNLRQVIREDNPDILYGARRGYNWSRNNGVPITLNETNEQLELFAMKDNWEHQLNTDTDPVTQEPIGQGAGLYFRTKANKDKTNFHTALCENLDPTGVEDGTLTINYWIDAIVPDSLQGDITGPVLDVNKEKIRAWFNSDDLATFSQNIRYTIAGEEITENPGRPHLAIVAIDGSIGSNGSHTEASDEDGCMSYLRYSTPDNRTIRDTSARLEIVQAFMFHHDNPAQAGIYLQDPDGNLVPWGWEAVAVNTAFGPVPENEFW